LELEGSDGLFEHLVGVCSYTFHNILWEFTGAALDGSAWAIATGTLSGGSILCVAASTQKVAFGAERLVLLLEFLLELVVGVHLVGCGDLVLLAAIVVAIALIL
jgi:hypothetical protein